MRKESHLTHLSDAQKLEIIHSSPSGKYSYPTTYMHGCNRHFKVTWLELHPWLYYSAKEDGAYCKACALFAPKDVSTQNLGTLVVAPFRTWTKQSSVFVNHEKCQYHLDSMAKMEAFKESHENSSQSIANLLQSAREERIIKNRQVIACLLKCIAFCGRLGITLRGHRDDYTADPLVHKGNFYEVVQFRAGTDDVLREHLQNAPKMQGIPPKLFKMNS